AADRVLDHDYVETVAARVEHTLLDTVVGGEPADVQSIDAATAQQLGKVRLLEGRVALAVRVLALVDDDVDLRLVEAWMECGAGCVPDAVSGPDRGRVDAVPPGGVGLDACKRSVVWWMPVACGDHELEVL